MAAKNFKISLANNKMSYYRSANAIFSKVGRSASEEVVVRLIFTKCVPILIYALDACPVSRAHQRTLDFITTRTFMRIFKTGSVDVVAECQRGLNCGSFTGCVFDRKRRFLGRFLESNNIICNLFSSVAVNELAALDSTTVSS